MIRRFNYTDRIKISRNRVSIALLSDNEGKYFKANVNLDGLIFPQNAKVFIEAYYKGVYQRFDFGNVEAIKEPANTRLTELPETELVYFDILIVDDSQKIGLLLGKANGISASTNELPNDRIPLLYVNPTDLKDQFWKISFDSSDDDRPILEINNRIPELSQMAKNDIKFIGLVYPVAFRIVLTKIIEGGELEFDEDHWVTQWLKFVSVVLCIKSVPDLDYEAEKLTPDQELWIDDCVNEYCKKYRLFEKFTTL